MALPYAINHEILRGVYDPSDPKWENWDEGYALTPAIIAVCLIEAPIPFLANMS
jgi:hypothetical protein